MAKTFSRRSFLKAAAGAAAAGTLAAFAPGGIEAATPQTSARRVSTWVWQFAEDGSPAEIRDRLAGTGIGIIVKTHDGPEWMAKYDKSPDAVTGPEQLSRLAAFFRQAGVPFSAWSVPTGEDPRREAAMCADVLRAGVDSLYLDLEPNDDGRYWQGTGQKALEFGQELRRLQPTARLVVAPDPRPWQVEAIPLREFASFCDEIAPQVYWRTFDSPTNRRMLEARGFTAQNGITPELITEVSVRTLASYGKPVSPIGQGDANADDWQRFLSASASHGLTSLSFWRFGTADRALFDLLRQPAPATTPASSPSQSLLGRLLLPFSMARARQGNIAP